MSDDKYPALNTDLLTRTKRDVKYKMPNFDYHQPSGECGALENNNMKRSMAYDDRAGMIPETQSQVFKKSTVKSSKSTCPLSTERSDLADLSSNFTLKNGMMKAKDRYDFDFAFKFSTNRSNKGDLATVNLTKTDSANDIFGKNEEKLCATKGFLTNGMTYNDHQAACSSRDDVEKHSYNYSKILSSNSSSLFDISLDDVSHDGATDTNTTGSFQSNVASDRLKLLDFDSKKSSGQPRLNAAVKKECKESSHNDFKKSNESNNPTCKNNSYEKNAPEPGKDVEKRLGRNSRGKEVFKLSSRYDTKSKAELPNMSARGNNKLSMKKKKVPTATLR